MAIRIIRGDALTGLASLPDESVHCCVTSPPYFGLRSYLPDNHPDKGKEIGLEATPEEFIANLVAVFREVRRVLRKDGVLFVNIGDSYCNADKWGGGGANTGKHTKSPDGSIPSWAGVRRKWKGLPGLKNKDLIGIPWLLAFALRADGWYLRGDYIWHKPSCMPESVTDRCTKSHEYVFHLTKSASYFWDQQAIAEPATDWGERTRDGKYESGGTGLSPHRGLDTSSSRSTRNKRSVWSINPRPFSESHFATMPPELAETCIKAGTSQKGCCSKCGAPWERDVERETVNLSNAAKAGTSIVGKGHATSQVRLDHDIRNGPTSVTKTTGWSPSCSCEDASVIPCTVLDPFSGAGTTALVADRLQRNAVGIELHPDYPDMAERRVNRDRGGLLDIMEEA